MRSKKKQNRQDYSAGSKKVSLLTWILPWLVLLPSFPAIHFYFKSGILFNTPGAEEAYLRAKNLFSLFYHTAIYGGAVFAVFPVPIGSSSQEISTVLGRCYSLGLFEYLGENSVVPISGLF